MSRGASKYPISQLIAEINERIRASARTEVLSSRSVIVAFQAECVGSMNGWNTAVTMEVAYSES